MWQKYYPNGLSKLSIAKLHQQGRYKQPGESQEETWVKCNFPGGKKYHTQIKAQDG